MLSDSELTKIYNLTSMGDFYPLDLLIDDKNFNQEMENVDGDWVTYNPRKSEYNRNGLSLFSLNGESDGKIDLDSLVEYNKENNTSYDEMSFRTPTKYWKYFDSISTIFRPIEKHIGRSHLLQLNKGGFFPPHRDLGASIRLIAFPQTDSNNLHLIVDNKKTDFQPYWIYFLNTRKPHSLMSFLDNALVLVLNLEVCDETVSFITKNLQAR